MQSCRMTVMLGLYATKLYGSYIEFFRIHDVCECLIYDLYAVMSYDYNSLCLAIILYDAISYCRLSYYMTSYLIFVLICRMTAIFELHAILLYKQI